jgi:hypothetical protein
MPKIDATSMTFTLMAVKKGKAEDDLIKKGGIPMPGYNFFQQV